VRFSLIPLIPQIDLIHKEGTEATDMNELELTFTADGIMVLNKDHKYYDLFRKAAVQAMRLKDRVIRKEYSSLCKQNLTQPLPVVYRYCLLAEIERRKLVKGGVK
jgi:hypothetical protein